MKKLLVFVAFVLATMSAGAQESYTRQGNTFTAVITNTGRNVRANADSTAYTWADAKGVKRPIWVSRTGSCFVIRVSKKTGNEYRQYCPREMSAAICKELGREYKPKTAKQ